MLSISMMFQSQAAKNKEKAYEKNYKDRTGKQDSNPGCRIHEKGFRHDID